LEESSWETLKLSDKYKDLVLELLWKEGKTGLISSQIHARLEKELGRRNVSRTAILLFLNQLVKEDVAYFVSETCRGGERRRYFPKKSKDEYRRGLIRNTVQDLFKSHPEYAMESFVEILKSEKLNLDVTRGLVGYFMSRDEICYSALEQALWDFGNPIRL
jgi:predicted transcriptional regulator